jgi:hypothetical protein
MQGRGALPSIPRGPKAQCASHGCDTLANEVRRECAPLAGAIGPQLRIVAHFAPTGVAVFCRLFIGKLTTFEGMCSRPRHVGPSAYVTGKPGDTVLVIRDVTERKRLEDQLSTMALTDGLSTNVRWQPPRGCSDLSMLIRH